MQFIYIYKYEYTYISWKYLYIHIMCTKCISNLPLPTSPLTPAPRPNVFLQQHRISTAAPSVANLPLEPVTFFQRWACSAKTDPQTSKVNSDAIKIILLMVQKSQITTWDVKETPIDNEKNYCTFQQVQDFFHQQYSNRYIRRVYENMST